MTYKVRTRYPDTEWSDWKVGTPGRELRTLLDVDTVFSITIQFDEGLMSEWRSQ